MPLVGPPVLWDSEDPALEPPMDADWQEMERAVRTPFFAMECPGSSLTSPRLPSDGGSAGGHRIIFIFVFVWV